MPPAANSLKPQASPLTPSAWDTLRHRLRGRLYSVAAARVGLPRARWHNVQRVVQAVLWFDQKGEGCWAGAAALADEADLSRTTLGRAKRDALDLGLLVIERRSNPGPYGGRLPDRLRVDVDRLRELIDDKTDAVGDTDVGGVSDPDSALAAVAADAPESGSETPPTQAGVTARSRLSVHRDQPSAQPDQPSAHDEEPSAQAGGYIEEEAPEPNSINQPPPPTTAAAAKGSTDAAWRVVEGELFQLGLNQAAAACRDARRAGLSPAEGHALVDHWRPRRAAWGEHKHAVLRRRFERARPRQPPDAEWPDYAEGAPRVDAERADRAAAERRHAQRRKQVAHAEPLIAPLSNAQRARLGVEAKRRYPRLATKGVTGRQVFEEGVAPLLAEWGAAGLERWLSEAA